ncbi:MAG: tryptophan synthase subunit alpha [Microthrixaceae bacterium]
MSPTNHPLTATHTPGRMEAALRRRRESGNKALVPYLTGGLGEWVPTIEAVAQAGADAIEVGIPFSDPVMDGPTIQAASDQALRDGALPIEVIEAAGSADVGIPLAVMTYYNLVFRPGVTRFAGELAQAGIAGAILPDLPLDEAGPWTEAADAAGVETVLLAAPTTPDERLERIAERSRGFLYAVGLLGITGERAELAASAKEIARRAKAVTDLPVLVGVGVSTPAQAVEVCEVADGVVVGSAVVRRVLEGGSPEQVADLVGQFREALDRGA